MPFKKIVTKIRQKNHELKGQAKYKRLFFWTWVSLVTFCLVMAFTTFAAIAVLSITLPDVTDLDKLSSALSTEIYDRNGKLIHTIHGEENREYIKYDEMSPQLINATIAIEDNQFWEHSGFDLSGIAAAGLHEVFGIGAARGGSTITQQYIKNTFLSPEKTYTRKLKELILAIKLENHYDKKEILELYLNKIPYGNNAYGIQKASEIYFGKPAKDLTLAESAVLAGIPKAPSYYNPLGENSHSHLVKNFTDEELHARNIKSESDLKDDEFVFGLIGKYNPLKETPQEEVPTDKEKEDATKTKEAPKPLITAENSVYIKGRADLVLERMNALGYITQEEMEQARKETQTIVVQKNSDNIKHYHFVFYVRQLLEEKYGKEIVEQGGLKVYTTIDSDLQDKAEQIVKERAEFNKKNYNAENAALVSVDPRNGQIMAMVGSADANNDEIEGKVNIATRKRQPGSSFKPFVYALAFYNGYGPASVVYDVQTKIGPDNPQDFDGQYQGPMSIRRALGQSRNIPAIKAYFLAGEQDPVIDFVTKLGITTLDKNNSYGYPLAIGAGEVRLLDMVTAYSTFANTGKKNEPIAILKVENSNGDVLEEWKDSDAKNEEVLDPQVAFLINDILSDASVKLGANLIVDGHTTATKTGTSTDKNKKEGGVKPRDLWTMGYTPSLVTGVWAGNNNPSEKPLNYNADGYNAAASIWKSFMKEALKDKPNEIFPVPEGIKYVAVSKANGKLPGPNTPADMIITEKFTSFGVPTEVDDSFITLNVDKISGEIVGEGCPKDMVEQKTFMNHKDIADREDWQAGVNAWVEGMRKKAQESGDTTSQYAFNGVAPTIECKAPTEEEKIRLPQVQITSPGSLSEIPTGKLDVSINVIAPNEVYEAYFYFDDQMQYSTNETPYTGKLRISETHTAGSSHSIRVKLYDKKGYSVESTIAVKIGTTDNTQITEPETTTTNTPSKDSTTPADKAKPISELILNPL